MQFKFIHRVAASMIALVFAALALVSIDAQQRKRPSRRATNPVRSQAPAPATSEPTLISTADQQSESTQRTSRQTRRTTAEEQRQQKQDQIQDTVNELSTKVERISDDVTQMRNDQRVLFELERLTRAEQRAENLRSQLRDVTDKEFQLQERLAQIADEITPESIQRRAAVYGTLNPSALRDQIQRSLERERDRVQKQLELTTNSRTRLEAAVASAETEVEKLRQKVDAAEQQGAPAAAGSSSTAVAPAPTPSPTPSPTPAYPPR
jgi:outer membrane murein-binding lipoprotein Lpp